MSRSAWAFALVLFAACAMPAMAGHWGHTGPAGPCSGSPFYSECESWKCGGGSCLGQCKYGGSATAICVNGQWNITLTCNPQPQPKPVAKCTTLPPSCPGVTWYHDDCYGKDKVYAYCGNGYTGVVTAICVDGHWYLQGSCKKIIYVPRPKPNCCYGLPPAVAGISWSPRCEGKSYCGANCMSGYCEGYVYSKCIDGQWSTPVGSCAPVVAAPPKKCYGKPKTCNLAAKWKCYHGKKCTAKCKWGCSGGYKAKCVDGKWVVSGSCAYKKWWIARYSH